MNEYGYARILGRIVIFILFFIYIYSLQLKFIPFGIGTRAVLGVVGICVYCYDSYRTWLIGRFHVDKNMLVLGFVLCLICFITFCSLTYNHTQDTTFFKYPVSITLILGAAYLLSYCVKIIHRTISFIIISRYVVIVVVVQMLLALAMYLQPSLRDFLNSFLYMSEFDKSMIAQTGGFRLIGFGAYFFGVGITNSCCLLLVAMIIKVSQVSYRVYLYYVIAFLIIAFGGLMMSRTTLVGIILAFLLLLYKTRLIKYELTYRFCSIYLSLLFLLGMSFFLFFLLPESIRNNVLIAGRFGFELFINYFREGELASSSTDVLMDMYILPDNLKTYIIGDGYYVGLGDVFSYYKEIDVGYLRLIYYFGIFGLGTYLFFQYLIIYFVKNRNSEKYSPFFVMLFILMLILNLKGFTDLFSFVVLFYFVESKGRKFIMHGT